MTTTNTATATTTATATVVLSIRDLQRMLKRARAAAKVSWGAEFKPTTCVIVTFDRAGRTDTSGSDTLLSTGIEGGVAGTSTKFRL